MGRRRRRLVRIITDFLYLANIPQQHLSCGHAEWHADLGMTTEILSLALRTPCTKDYFISPPSAAGYHNIMLLHNTLNAFFIPFSVYELASERSVSVQHSYLRCYYMLTLQLQVRTESPIFPYLVGRMMFLLSFFLRPEWPERIRRITSRTRALEKLCNACINLVKAH